MNFLKSWVLPLYNKVVTKLKSEPLVVTAAVVSAIVWLGGHFNIVLDQPTITAVVAPLVAAIFGRLHVIPIAKINALLVARKCDKPGCEQ